MSTLYLIEGNNNTLLSSKIDDTVNISTVEGEDDSYPLRGNFGVTVPFDVPLDDMPLDLNGLIYWKYLGMLSIYPGYSFIQFDEQVDSTGWDYSASTSAFLGNRQTVGITGESTAVLQSTMSTLFSSPTSCIFRFEMFRYTDSDVSDLSTGGDFTRNYTAVHSGAGCSISFNNGSTWNVVQSGVLNSIDVPDQGNQFLVRFFGFSGNPTYLASWALIY